MTVAAKQFEFQINGRGLLIDTTQPASSGNLQFILDTFDICGVSASDLDATQVQALTDAVATIIETVKSIS